MDYNIYAFVSSLILLLNLYNLSFIEIKLKHILILNVLIWAIMKITGIQYGNLIIPYTFIVSILYLQILNRNLYLNIIGISLSILIFLFIDGVLGYVIICIFHITKNIMFQIEKNYIQFHIVLFVMNFIFTKLIGRTFNIILKKLHINTSRIIKFIAADIFIILIAVYTVCMLDRTLKIYPIFLQINTSLIIMLCVSIIITFYIYEEYIKKDLHAMYTSREFNQLKQYVSSVENMYNEMRKMKHDYVNILCSINGYIEQDNSKELKKYFNENILNLNDNLSISAGNLMKLKHIKVDGVKGLIFSKMLQAKKKSIELFLDISEDIEKFYIESIDLCRILGIFWDNAIEEAELCNGAKIKFGVIKLENSMVIVLINSCRSNIPYIYKMFEHGFSTKGENRGIGLSNVKDLIDKKYNNVTLNTYVENNEFKQEIIIDYK